MSTVDLSSQSVRTNPSTAYVRSNIRKYGGYLNVTEPLPCPLQFQIMDMKVLDPNELIGTNVDYNSYMCKDVFYQNSVMSEEIQLNDWSQVIMLGRTEFGNSICVRVPFQPYMYLYASGIKWTTHEQHAMQTFLARALGLEYQDIKITFSNMKRLDGWVPDPEDMTKTEEIPVLRVSVPNKKTFERMVDTLDASKGFEKILQGTLKKTREEMAFMTSYKYCSKFRLEKLTKTLNGVEGRMRSIKNNVERAKKDPDDIRGGGDISQLPSQFAVPDLTEDLTFQCKDLTRIWEMWKERRRLVYQYMEWWKQTGFKIKNIQKLVKTSLWETRVDHVHKFCDLTRIIPSGWVEMLQYERPEGYISHSQIECLAHLPNIKPLDKHSVAPLLMASVDGEMYSSNPRSFPNPLRPDNHVITIGVVLCRTNSVEMERFVFCLRSVDVSQITNATVFQFDDEQELLKRWRDFMTVESDPDFVTGYNILGFDWRYFAHRAAKTFANKEIAQKMAEEEDEDGGGEDDGGDDDESHPNTSAAPKSKRPKHTDNDNDDGDDLVNVGNLLDGSSRSNIIGPGKMGDPNFDQTVSRFFRLSRIWAELTPCRPQVFKSSAYGERWSYHFDMTGRATQDLLIYVRREHKLESYKLDDVSFHFLKDRKIDLDHKLLFKYFESGPKERGLIAEYCVKDCILPIQLCKHPKLMVVQNLIEMSRVTYTPLPQIINRGQQIKVFNQLVWYAHLGGFVMNDQPHRDVDGYEGATVLDPKPGWYDCPIVVLDFASLYPSVMINKNLCYSTLVRDPKYMNLSGVEYNVIKIGDRTHVFVKNKTLKGVLPTLEENLLAARKSVKKQMKTETDKEVYAMLDAKQLAIKVSCNSAYGFTGAGNGMYPEPAIAESITATGRVFIDTTREFILAHYEGSDVIYGDTDSVFIKFKVTPDKEGLKKAFDMGLEAAESISKLFGEAVKLEREKAYFPYLLYGKKRYIGLKYEELEKSKGLDTKGIEIARRDWSPLIRTIYKKCIDKVFFDRDVEGSKKMLTQYCQDMIDNKLDPSWFVMSKELKSGYANEDSQVHVAVVKKIARRSPGSEPQVGDRVPYVIVRTEKKTKRTCEKSEDPEYARVSKKRLDYEYYLQKQLERPLTDFFQMFQQDKDLFTDVRRQLHNEYAGVGRNGLMAYFTPKVDNSGESKSESKYKDEAKHELVDSPSPSLSLPTIDSHSGHSNIKDVKDLAPPAPKRHPNPQPLKTLLGQSSQSASASASTTMDFILDDIPPAVKLEHEKKRKSPTQQHTKPKNKKGKTTTAAPPSITLLNFTY